MQKSEIYKKKYDKYLNETGEVGTVSRVVSSIAYVEGLPNAKTWELVYFESGYMGVVRSLNEEESEIMVFSNESVSVNTKVTRTNLRFKVPVGDSVLGNIVNALGEPIYSDVYIPNVKEYREIDIKPLGIEDRARITEPLETGVSMVDFLIPLGKGQRELIIGDRNIGKTSFVLQTMLTQANKDTICVYVGIGGKISNLKMVESFFEKYQIKDRSLIVASTASDPIAEIFLTPYTAMTYAEYFRDQGKDVLIIFDDLTTHAKYYRELSLLSKRFPGRDSYPGDIFYVHARLLERAGNFKVNGKNVSITCLGVAETIGGDMSGYVQTNLMSITDGHIFFDLDHYRSGKRPAINYFLSVTRVGRQTQSPIRWGINRELSTFMVLHNKTERFIHFGAEINEGIRSTLSMGNKIGYFFDQSTDDVMDINVQILIFSLIWTGLLREDSKVKIKFYCSIAQKLYVKDDKFKEMVDSIINSSKDFNEFLSKISSRHMEFVNYLENQK